LLASLECCPSLWDTIPSILVRGLTDGWNEARG
jgi:hypothetical protein